MAACPRTCKGWSGERGSGKWESGEVESIERKSVEQCGGQRRGLTVRRCVEKQNP